jgi:hypothetical protein
LKHSCAVGIIKLRNETICCRRSRNKSVDESDQELHFRVKRIRDDSDVPSGIELEVSGARVVDDIEIPKGNCYEGRLSGYRVLVIDEYLESTGLTLRNPPQIYVNVVTLLD